MKVESVTSSCGGGPQNFQPKGHLDHELIGVMQVAQLPESSSRGYTVLVPTKTASQLPAHDMFVSVITALTLHSCGIQYLVG